MFLSRYLLFILTVIASILVVPALFLGLSGIYQNVVFHNQPIIYQVSNRMKHDVLIVATGTQLFLFATNTKVQVGSTSTHATSTTHPSVRLISSPAEVLGHQENKLKILLLGSDERNQADNLRTDTIVLIIIDKVGKRVSALSFPRDLFVRLPDGSMGRINNAYEIGGFSGLNDTLLYNFGISADHFVLTNFTGFKKLIDDLGGIDVKVGADFADWRSGQWIEIKTGLNHFNGEEALWYVRSRETSDDLDRNRRTQEVINAIWHAVLKSDNFNKIPELYNNLKGLVKTDMQARDIIDVLQTVWGVGTDVKIKKYTFGVDEVVPWTVPASGAMVLLPKREEISMLILRALGD
jgi:LCP family protein required for cell wall assembly